MSSRKLSILSVIVMTMVGFKGTLGNHYVLTLALGKISAPCCTHSIMTQDKIYDLSLKRSSGPFLTVLRIGSRCPDSQYCSQENPRHPLNLSHFSPHTNLSKSFQFPLLPKLSPSRTQGAVAYIILIFL